MFVMVLDFNSRFSASITKKETTQANGVSNTSDHRQPCISFCPKNVEQRPAVGPAVTGCASLHCLVQVTLSAWK